MTLLRSNAFVTSLALAISSATNLGAIFIWTRLLPPAEFGVYALVSAMALLLNALCFEWLRQTGARTLYDSRAPFQISPPRAEALLALYAGAVIAFVAAIFALAVAGVKFSGLSPHWWPGLAAFTLSEMALAIVNTVSRVRLDAWQYFRSMVFRSILSLALGIMLVTGLDMGATGAIGGIIVSQSLVFLASVALDPLWRRIRPWRARRGEVLACVGLGYPLIASCGLNYGAGVVDRFLIAGALGVAAIGPYSAPADLMQKTLVFVMMAINLTAYPTIVRRYEDHGPDAAAQGLQANFHVLLALGVPAAIGIAVLAPGIAKLMLGSAYRGAAADLLPVIAGTALLRGLISFHLAMVFQLCKRMTLMLAAPAAVVSVMLLLGPQAMHRWGLPGMAATALLAQIGAFALCYALARRLMPIRLFSADAVKIIAAGFVMGALLYPFRHMDGIASTLILTVTGALEYGVLLLVLRVKPVIAALGALPVARRLVRGSATAQGTLPHAD